ncbi:hypothetical protein J7K27_08745 [Candidatus Bathyarchaeota archaeon]|nr:hypothetical protein [Candidatus Bathyarchaeota archaeon]
MVVSCGKKKVWNLKPSAGPTAARNAYVGAPFRVNKKYAERFADRWVILSAKYGFIDPDFVIPENYDATFKDPSTNPVGIDRLRQQVKGMELHKFDKVIVLGGKVYCAVCIKAFEGFNVKIIAPTLGLPLGKAMQKVREAIQLNRPFDC